ncbi:MAG: glycosyltransferase [Longimonas sp.]|uniref:glycosyltransferase n=1 Tax=Longimonas sp. TaxID=2039626 RepID=UPI0033591B84
MPAERRVLLIAYYMPPAGGPAVQRILQFVEGLPAHNWQVDVLTVQAGAYPTTDPGLQAAVPPSVRVHRTPALDPYALYARLQGAPRTQDAIPAGSFDPRAASWTEHLARWVRANIFLPDARIGWWPFGVWRGLQLLKQHRYDAVLTSGAPHSVHCIGHTLHRITSTPWVADLHDPWTDIGFYDELPHTRWARHLDAALERAVLQTATRVTTVSPTWRALFQAKGATMGPVVENGFAASDMDALDVPVRRDRFALSHVGSLYANRNPVALWDALADLRGQGLMPLLELQLVGRVAPVVEEALRARGLLDCTTVVSFVPHEKALRYMAESALLVLCIEPFGVDTGMITSKLYEYLSTGRPVLGIGPPGGDAADLLRQHDAGVMAARDDVTAVKEMLMSHYAAWADGAPLSGAVRAALASHTRTAQARRMAHALTDAHQSA